MFYFFLYVELIPLMKGITTCHSILQCKNESHVELIPLMKGITTSFGSLITSIKHFSSVELIPLMKGITTNNRRHHQHNP